MSVRIGILGAAGRMGRTLIEGLSERPDLQLGAAIVAADSAHVGMDPGHIAGVGETGIRAVDDTLQVVNDFEILIDFTSPETTMEQLAICRQHGKAMVIGTTGLNANQMETLREAGQTIPVLFAPNMSVGISLLSSLLADVARRLGPGYDVEIIEAHHRFKKDAPSGTALRLGEVVAEGLGRRLEDCAVYGRHGIGDERDPNIIGFETIRGGDIVGDHTVLFAGMGERLEFTHKASSRMTFASGALRAAAWISGQSPGFYSMHDVLGL